MLVLPVQWDRLRMALIMAIIFLASYLSWAHFTGASVPCPVNFLPHRSVDCPLVLHSSGSVILGVPLSVWGGVWALAAFVIVRMRRSARFLWMAAGVGGLAWAVGHEVILHVLCAWCTVIQMLAAGLMAGDMLWTYLAGSLDRQNQWVSGRALVRRKIMAVMLALLLVFGLAGTAFASPGVPSGQQFENLALRDLNDLPATLPQGPAIIEAMAPWCMYCATYARFILPNVVQEARARGVSVVTIDVSGLGGLARAAEQPTVGSVEATGTDGSREPLADNRAVAKNLRRFAQVYPTGAQVLFVPLGSTLPSAWKVNSLPELLFLDARHNLISTLNGFHGVQTVTRWLDTQARRAGYTALPEAAAAVDQFPAMPNGSGYTGDGNGSTVVPAIVPDQALLTSQTAGTNEPSYCNPPLAPPQRNDGTYTGVWNGRTVTLDYRTWDPCYGYPGPALERDYGTCGPTGCVPGAHPVGWISNVQTTSAANACIDGSTLPVWTTPDLPGSYVVFFGNGAMGLGPSCLGPPDALTFPTSDGPPPSKGQLALSVRVTPNPAQAGGDVTLVATLSRPITGGSVSFTSDPANLLGGTVPVPPCRVVGGRCTATAMVPAAGRWTIHARWSGDMEYQPASAPAVTLTSFSSCGASTCYWGLGWGDRTVTSFVDPLPVTWNSTPCLGICYGNTFQNLPEGVTGATALTAGIADQGVENWIWASYVPPCLGTCGSGATDQVKVRAHLVTVLLSNDIGALANAGTSILYADADWPYLGQQHADLGLSTYVTIDADALGGQGETIMEDIGEESDDGLQAAAVVMENILDTDTQGALAAAGAPNWSQAVANLDNAVQSGGVGPSYYSTTWQQDMSVRVGHGVLLGFSPQLMAANAGVGATGAFAVTFVQLEVTAKAEASAQASLTPQVVLGIGSRQATLGGVPVNLTAAPVIRNGRTMVPLGAVANLLGAQVLWNGATRRITLVRSGQELVMAVGQTRYWLDGAAETMDTAPFIEAPGYTMVPVSFIAQAFGLPVSWNPQTQQVTIGSK